MKWKRFEAEELVEYTQKRVGETKIGEKLYWGH